MGEEPDSFEVRQDQRAVRPWLRVLVVILLGAALTSSCSEPAPEDGAGGSPTSTTSGVAESTTTAVAPTLDSFAVPAGSRPHDVWAARNGEVWYTAQGSGELGILDPASGRIREWSLGRGSRPHGVIEGPDGRAWVTDSGLNAILSVDAATGDVRRYQLPGTHSGANLNTAVFDPSGTLWFTGQSGVYGRIPAGGGEAEVFDAPRGRGPYGITATDDAVYYASLAGSHVARVDPTSAAATVLEPPTPDQGTRRVWADSSGRVWSSQWNSGKVAVYDPGDSSWREWLLPGDSPQAYAVYVDDRDVIWLSDFTANSIVSFDPATESFSSFPLPSNPSNVRQIHGRPGEVWGAESAADKLVVVRTG